jgi:uncharacterized protein
MIIDAHMHLGDCRVFDLNIAEDELLRSMDANHVDVSVVQPFPGAPDAARVHRQIRDLAQRHPGRIYGMASVNPHVPKAAYVDEVTRCVESYGFVAVKLHTIGHAVSPMANDAGTVFETAARLRVPVMIHTGMGLPFAAPALAIPRAREHPDLPIILAHAGFVISTGDAYAAAKECSNLYLEPSWCMKESIGWLVRDLGADRVMLGSDLPSNTHVELEKVTHLGLGKGDLDKMLGGTAAKLFGLPRR